MEVHELANIVKERFDTQDKILERLDEKVTSHDRWLWFGKGLFAVLAVLLGWLHIRITWGG